MPFHIGTLNEDIMLTILKSNYSFQFLKPLECLLPPVNSFNPFKSLLLHFNHFFTFIPSLDMVNLEERNDMICVIKSNISLKI